MEFIDNHLDEYHEEPQLVDPPFKCLADVLKSTYDLPDPINFKNALKLYICLVELIDQLI